MKPMLLAMFASLSMTAAVAAQGPAASQPAAGARLAEHQRVIRDRLSRLEDKMFQLSKVLARTEPKQAERLQDAFREARAKLLQSRMDSVAGKLEKAQLSDAADEQARVVGDLETLLRTLLDETDDAHRKEEIERLEQFRKRLDKIIEDQARQKEAAEHVAQARSRLEQLKKSAERVADLVRRQDASALRRSDAERDSEDEGRNAAREQAKIREDTKQAAEDLKAADSPEGDRAGKPDSHDAKSAGQGETPSAHEPMPDAEGASDKKDAEPKEGQADGDSDSKDSQGLEREQNGDSDKPAREPAEESAQEPAKSGAGENPRPGDSHQPDKQGQSSKHGARRTGDPSRAEPSGEMKQPGRSGQPGANQGQRNAGKPKSGAQSSPRGNAQPQASQDGHSAESQAAGDIQRAAEEMKKAEAELEKGRRAEARPAQEQGAKELRSALQRLQHDISEAEKQLDMARQAREQRKTADETRELARDMKGKKPGETDPQSGGKSEKSDEQQSGGQQSGQGQPQSGEQSGQQQDGQQQQSGEQQQQGGQQQGGQQQSGQQQGGQQQGGQQQGGQQQDGQQQQNGGEQDSQQQQQQQTPGQQGVEDAVPEQEQAQDKLEKEDAQKAAEKQQKALEKLEQSREELEEALEQLRKEQQEELLAELDTRFNAMLARQLTINKTTTQLDAIGRAKWSRADQLDLARTAEDQRWVSGEADKVSRMLKEEGTTIVVPEVMGNIRDDANEVAGRLTTADTGATVRLLEIDIAETLKELIDAVKEKQKKNEDEEQQQQQGGGDQERSLLPGSAELKMLRSSQMRVNRATGQHEQTRALPETDLDQLEKDVARTAKRQAAVAGLAKSMEESRAREEEESEEAP